ncbi:MAG: DUF5011 domain-containing protein [Bacilli bacterium]|nr:DUF5011 domain-containing protein [Bacilli bacterium]
MLNKRVIITVAIAVLIFFGIFAFAQSGDNTKPVITLEGDETVEILLGSEYTDAGATATDDIDGDITDKIVVSGEVDTSVVDTYTLTYNVSDEAGNEADEVTRTVKVLADTTIPTINLIGGAVTLEVGSVYNDAGATATDNVDGDLTASIVTTNPVNTAVVGVYTVTYNVSDASGNAALPVTRTVNIVDTTIPVITLIGTDVTVEYGSPYTDQGATALDNYDGDITANIITVSTVNLNVLGTYSVTYNVTDANGNIAATVTRTVTVVDTTKPIIILNGENPTKVILGINPYVDELAILDDNYDADSTITGLLSGDPTIIGNYYLLYNGSDISGNAAVEVSRTVEVLDPNADEDGDQFTNIEEYNEKTDYNDPDDYPILGNPEITVLGTNPITVDQFTTYTDAGATAVDSIGTALTVNVSNPVNTNVINTYTVTYTATDRQGNTDTDTRTVIIKDKIKPTIYITGLDEFNIYQTNIGIIFPYIEWGAVAFDNIDGNITSRIQRTGSVNENVVGTYYITYTVSDTAGNIATKTKTVHVIDKEDPNVSFSPNGSGISKRTHSTVVNVTDNSAVNNSNLKYQWTQSRFITPSKSSFVNSFSNGDSITTPAGVNGKYYLWIYAEDIYGNSVIENSNSFILDNTTPSITLKGNNPYLLQLGETYVEPKAKVTDNGNTITNNLNPTSNNINNMVIGTYYVNYSYTDQAGNTGTATRTVLVGDTIAPIITINPYILTPTNQDIIVTASTNEGTLNTPTHTFTANGSFTFTATDGAGNTTNEEVTITNIDKELPVINSIAGNSTTWVQNVTLTVNATDNVAILEYSFDNGVNWQASASKTFTSNINIQANKIKVKDTAGNIAAYTLPININKIDTQAPIITVNPNAKSVVVGGTYNNMQGVSATDNHGTPTITSNYLSTMLNAVGVYTITYTATDSAGNTATATRTLTVLADTTGPDIDFNYGGGPGSKHLHSIEITDNNNIVTLKYRWQPNDTWPNDNSFVDFTLSGDYAAFSLDRPSGKHYLQIIAIDSFGNESRETSDYIDY